MKFLLIALLALIAGPAAAQGSCTFVYNTVSKKIESRCQGVPAAPLGVEERVALISGRVKSCVVAVERVAAKQLQPAAPVCK